jgi:hypothetical protein
VSTIIAGIRTAEQVQQNTSGIFKLDSADMLMIEQLGKTDFVQVMDLIQKQG